VTRDVARRRQKGAEWDCYRKVNVTMHVQAASCEDVRAKAGDGWACRVKAWRQLVEDCGRKPSRGRVHGLRVATLRLQTELEQWLAEADAADPARLAVGRWMKQADRLRDALKEVRETDVHLGVLAEMRGPGDARRKTLPRQCSDCREESRKLERRLEKTRREAATELAAALEKWNRRHAKLGHELETALGPVMVERAQPGAEDVRRMVEATARDFAVLAAENLHEYRKRLKEARYVADLGAETDVVMRRQAAILGRMQTAAGEWHDWEALTRVAERQLGMRKRKEKLVEMLEIVAEAKLSKALSYCRRMTARLLRHCVEADEEALPPKKPVVRAEAARAAQSKSA
jgi:hypothetical protein